MFNAGTISSILPSSPYVDDFVPLADIRQCYGLNKLVSTYNGNAIRVRRSSDNTEQNIGFVDDELDTASLLTFVGGGNGFVVTWYDQSGNADDMTQGTSAAQPRIVNGGVFDGEIVFDGSDDFLSQTAATPANTSSVTVFLYTQINKTGTGTVYMAAYGGYSGVISSGWALYYDPRSSGVATPGYSSVFSSQSFAFNIESIGFSGTPTIDDTPKNVTIVYDRDAVNALDRCVNWVGGTFYEGVSQTATSSGGTFDATTVEIGSGLGLFSNLRAKSYVVCANDQRTVRPDVEALLS